MKTIKELIDLYDWLKKANIKDPLLEKMPFSELIQNVFWTQTLIQNEVIFIMSSKKRIKGVFVGWPTKGRIDKHGTAVPDIKGDRFYVRFSYISPKYRSSNNLEDICVQIYKCWPQIKGMFHVERSNGTAKPSQFDREVKENEKTSVKRSK